MNRILCMLLDKTRVTGTHVGLYGQQDMRINHM